MLGAQTRSGLMDGLTNKGPANQQRSAVIMSGVEKSGNGLPHVSQWIYPPGHFHPSKFMLAHMTRYTPSTKSHSLRSCLVHGFSSSIEATLIIIFL